MREIRWVVVMAALATAAGCGPRRQPPTAPETWTIEPAPASQPADESATRPAPVALVEVGPASAPTTQPSPVPADDPSPTTAPDEPATTPATTQAIDPATTGPTTTQSTTQEAATRPESPRQVLAGVMNATFRGDVEGVRSRLFVAGDESQRLADAMADVARAAGKVREAAAAKFGEEEVRKLDVDVVPPVVIASAVEHLDGDRAVVKLQGQNGNGIVFQKTDGTWKMSLPELIDQQKQGRSIDQLVNDTRAPVARFEDLAQRVNEGKFESVEQLLAELAQTFFSAQQGK